MTWARLRGKVREIWIYPKITSYMLEGPDAGESLIKQTDICLESHTRREST